MPADRPILFSGAMVRAILTGRKTQTRRVMRPQPPPGADRLYGPVTCPYGAAGDTLWVREQHAWADRFTEDVERDPPTIVAYRADGTFLRFWTDASDGTPHRGRYDFDDANLVHPDLHWRPSIHMPRWASRLTLEVEEVRVQRLQEISEEDARAEGIAGEPGRWEGAGSEIDRRTCPGGYWWTTARDAFSDLWDSINAARGYPWASDPWVWCVTFRRVEVPCE